MRVHTYRANTVRLPSPKASFLAISIVFILSGCAVDPGNSVDVIQKEIASIAPTPLMLIQDNEQQRSVDQRVTALLLQPLTLDSAVEIATLNNKSIQAALHSLGISAVELQQATQLPNPGITLTRSTSDGSYSTELEFGINLLSVLTLPKVRSIETQRFQQERLSTAQEIASIINETKIAYWNAVAAREVLSYIEKVHTTTQASAELANRMTAAGNFSKLDYLREQGQLSEATLNLVTARQAVYSSTEQLNRLLGLWSNIQKIQLPERLPELPTEIRQVAELEANALEQRLDVKLAKMKLQMIAANAGLTKATRFINAFDFEAGGNTKDSSERSYSASLELPIFDWGNYRVRKVEAEYWQAFNEATATGVNARSEIRERYLIYRSMYDLASHYKSNVLPIQQQIAEENQLRYNGMFISVFELVADARNQISAVTGYVNAAKDFWVAKSQLDLALIGAPVVVGDAEQTKPAAKAESAGH